MFFTFLGKIHVWWPELCILIFSSCWLAVLTNPQKTTGQVWVIFVSYFGMITGLWNVGRVLSGSTTHSPTFYFCRTNHISKLNIVSYGFLIEASQGNLSLFSCKFVFYLVIQGRVWTLLRYLCISETLALSYFMHFLWKVIIFNNSEFILFHFVEIA